MSIKLRKLLQWSMMATGEEHLICLGLLAWLGAVIDNSMHVDDASDNPFDAPELVGPKGRLCKISLNNHIRIAAIASAGKTFKSPQALLKGQRTLKGHKVIKKDKTANKWVEPHAYRYLGRVKEVFKSGKSIPVISIAWDATRLQRKDTLVATIYNAATRQAAWCPPMVPIVFCVDAIDAICIVPSTNM